MHVMADPSATAADAHGRTRTVVVRWCDVASRASRHPVAVLTMLTVLAWVPHAGRVPISWHFFRTAGLLVRGGHLLGVYGTHPDLQFGPVSFLASTLFSFFPPDVGRAAAMLCMAALGVVTLTLVHSLVPAGRPDAQLMWWMGAAVAVCAWSEIAFRYAHLDDALALTLATAGVVALRRGHPMAAAVLLALSVDAKPWAAPLGVVLLAAGRRRWVAVAVFAFVVAAVWSPFVFGGLHSMNAAAFRIPVAPGSSLTLLPGGFSSTPWWCRPAQIAGGALLAWAAVRARSVSAAFLCVFAVRLLLDPGMYAYYDIEAVLGALLCDVTLLRDRIPWFTVTAAVTVYAPAYVLTGLPTVHAWVRTVGLVALIAGALFLAFRRSGPSGDTDVRVTVATIPVTVGGPVRTLSGGFRAASAPGRDGVA